MVDRAYPNWLLGAGLGGGLLCVWLLLLGLAQRATDLSNSTVEAGSYPIDSSPWIGRPFQPEDLKIDRVLPPPGAVLTSFTQFRIWFSQPIGDLSLNDFRANGRRPLSVTGSGPGPYVVLFEAIAGQGVAVEFTRTGKQGLGNELSQRWGYELSSIEHQESVRLKQLEFLVPDYYPVGIEQFRTGVIIENEGEQFANCLGWRILFTGEGKSVPYYLPPLIIPGGKEIFVPSERLTPLSNRGVGIDIGATGVCHLQNADEAPITLDSANYSFSAAVPGMRLARDGDSWRGILGKNETPLPNFGPWLPAPPVPDHAPGRYHGPLQIKFSAVAPEAEIWFTNDGGSLSGGEIKRYEEPIPISQNSTVRAFTKLNGCSSMVGSYTYVIQGGSFASGLPTLVLSSRAFNSPGTGLHRQKSSQNRNEGAAVEFWGSGERQVSLTSAWVSQATPDEDRRRSKKQALDLVFSQRERGLEEWLAESGIISSVEDRRFRLLPAAIAPRPEVIDWVVGRVGGALGGVKMSSGFVNLVANGTTAGVFRLVPSDAAKSSQLEYRGAKIVVRGDALAWCALVDDVMESDLSDDQQVVRIAQSLDLEAFARHVLLTLFWGERFWPSRTEAVRLDPQTSKWSFAVHQGGAAGRNWEGPRYSDFTEKTSVAGLMFDALLRSVRFRTIFTRLADRLFDPNSERVGILTEEAVDALTKSGGKYAASAQRVFTDSKIRARLVQTREFLSRMGWAGFSHGPVTPMQRTISNVGAIEDTKPEFVAPIHLDSNFSDLLLVPRGSKKRLWVPVGSSSSAWVFPEYDDRQWMRLNGLIGFDQHGLSGQRIGSKVEQLMQNRSTSAFIRIPFDVSLERFKQRERLVLRVKINDGFVAYLNGTEILRVNAPEVLHWNSGAKETYRRTAWRYREFDISQHRSLIRSQANLLALHGLNFMKNGTSFLIDVELVARVSPNRLFGWRGIRDGEVNRQQGNQGL